MKKHRFLAGVLSLAVALTSMTSMVFAASFDDVENDPTVSWAKPSINQMTEAGYIKGYEDGTFKPYRAISKMECLLLMSRMLGVEESDYSDIAEKALDTYESAVSKYNTTYVDELCYLMYLGIINETDLVSYASAANANTELLRHQAAILMSKMLGQNTTAKAYDVSASEYADNASIPSVSKPYVEYVTAEGIMNGMDKTEDGRPQFSPLTSLTRAQMATLLARTTSRLGKFVYEGKVVSLDLDNYKMVMSQGSDNNKSERIFNEDTIVWKSGKTIKVSSLEEGAPVTAIEINGHIQLIIVNGEGSIAEDDEPVNEGTVVYAKITQTSQSGNGKKITIHDTEDSSNKATYTVSDDCVFTVNGVKATFNDMTKNKFVKATVLEGLVIALEISDSVIDIDGVITDVSFDEEDHVYITIEDEENGEQLYVVSNKGATVKRDGIAAEYRELAAGDKVKAVLTYGKITSVNATSNSEKFSGVLSEIIIAKKPSLTILIDGEEKNFTIRSNARIVISGMDAEIYDLRPGVSVTGTIDGTEIKLLTTSTVATNEKGEFTATAVAVNTTYKVITVTDDDGNSQSVYYNSKTTFLKSSGSTAKASDIEKGATLSITGAETNGVFEATIIIIK